MSDPNIVWIVTEDYGQDNGIGIRGVFATKELAEDHIASVGPRKRHRFDVEAYTVTHTAATSKEREYMSKERPILFSSSMVRAILDGRKTMTRRVVDRDLWDALDDGVPSDQQRIETDDTPMGGVPATRFCKYGQPGDRLWVRETWASFGTSDSITPPVPRECQIRYHADNKCEWRPVPDGSKGVYPDASFRLHPSIHMPQWASRITLEVTAVRVERVQEITEADSWAEGCVCRSWESPLHDKSWDADTYASNVFSGLWDSINAKRGFGWAVNPWVWVVEFRRVKP